MFFQFILLISSHHLWRHQALQAELDSQSVFPPFLLLTGCLYLNLPRIARQPLTGLNKMLYAALHDRAAYINPLIQCHFAPRPYIYGGEGGTHVELLGVSTDKQINTFDCNNS